MPYPAYIHTPRGVYMQYKYGNYYKINTIEINVV